MGLKDAAALIGKGWNRKVRIYDFPAEHWRHLRMSNVIELPFAALRLRTDAAKRYRKIEYATAVIFKLPLIAKKTFRKFNAPGLMKELFHGAKYVDGRRAETDHQGPAA
jgi:hypothetical protein